ncbi:MAG: pilus assembly protein [Betaproteobacteria bacterium]|nr:pilus assembly protein [Betaproteobacteria bacterium]
MGNKTPRIQITATLLALLAFALLALPLGAGAAGLGKVTVLSALGQPLRAEVDITASREELTSLAARIASPNAFKQAGIEYAPALTSVRITVDKRPDGQPFLSMVSDRPVNDPFLDLLVELDWTSGRLVREYTFLLDPPTAPRKLAAAAVTAPVIQPPVKSEPPATIAPVPPAPVIAKQPEMPVVAPSAPSAPASVAPGEQQTRPETKAVHGAGERPGREKPEKPAQKKLPQEAATRLVKHGDTLSQIATETMPAGVSLDQMLVALFAGNRDAFEGNVNRLKEGKILAIPDRETVSAVDAEEARTTIRVQAADFDAYRKKLAAAAGSAAPQKEAEPKRAVSGKIQPKVEDKAPAPVPGKDKLEISRSEAASGKAGSGRIAAIEETLIAREKALKEANSRIAELEKNLQDLKKLVELKNQSMADLQKQAQPVPPAATAAEVKKPETAAKTPVASAPSVQPPAPATTPSVKKPLPPSSPPAPPSFIEQSPEIVYGGGAILALLLGYFGYARWRKQRQADDQAATEVTDSFSEQAAGSPSESSMGGGQRVDTNDLLAQTDFSSQSGMAVSGAAGVDPVAEAEVYMAYGRDTQAEEILLDAQKSDPVRPAIQLKLLEIYVARKSVKQFETIATALHQQTGGAGDDWEAAAKLGRQVDPENPLYSVAGMGTDAGAESATHPSDMLAPEQMDAVIAEDGLAPAEQNTQAAMDEAPAGMPQQHGDSTASLDFELDLSADAQEPSPSVSEPVSAVAPPDEALAGSMDLDLDLDLALEPDAGVLESAADNEKQKKQPDNSDESVHELDFDFDLGGVKPSDTPASLQLDDDNLIDFDLALPSVAQPPTPEKLDLSSISLELDESSAPPPSPTQPAASNLDLSSISLDFDEPSPAAPAATAASDDAAMQEVATKFELALAYEEMGDKEGARELLQEVINEGSVAQQTAARNKLAQLG